MIDIAQPVKRGGSCYMMAEISDGALATAGGGASNIVTGTKTGMSGAISTPSRA